jgi:hypothetical protein
MAKTKISEFSSTASNNTDIDGISVAEGMAPSNVNNAIRELMSQLKDWQSGAVSQDMSVNGALTVSGNTVLSANLTATGNATISGAAVLSSTLAVSGNTNLAAVTCSGATVLGSTLAVTGATSLAAVTCSGAAVLSSTLAVAGATNLQSGVTLGTSTSNTVTLNALLSAGGGTGTSGQILKSNGTSSAPSWGSAITSGTAQASTSGTSIDFNGIPSWVKRITVMFNGVSVSGTSAFLIQIGSGSFTTSGYQSGSCGASTSSNVSVGINSTAGFIVHSLYAAGANSGIITLALVSSNTWVESHSSYTVGGAFTFTFTGGGTVALGGTLDRVRITTANGTDTFDAGSINILYE